MRLAEIITNSENDTLITVTDTSAQIKNTGSNVTISTGDFKDYIYNTTAARVMTS